MICPHCLKTIEDGASFWLLYCNAYVGPGDTEFVFCSVRAAIAVFLST